MAATMERDMSEKTRNRDPAGENINRKALRRA